MSLCTPFIWASETTKLYFAVMNVRQRIRCIREFSLLEPEFIRAPTIALSDLISQSSTAPRGLLRVQLVSSLELRLSWFHGSHLAPLYAPRPQLPDASLVTANWGFALSKRASIEVPFHSAAKTNHHKMSDLAETLRRTKLSKFFTAVERVISRRKNDRPWRNAFDACCREPIRQSSSLFLPAVRPSNSDRN